jgi:hypothetical protein
MITKNDLQKFSGKYDDLSRLIQGYGSIKLAARRTGCTELADRANNCMNAISNEIGKILNPMQDFDEVILDELPLKVNPKLVTIQYFKSSGKYYSTGEYETEHTHMQDVFDEVRQFQLEGKLPGLVEGGGKSFTIYVNADDHPNGYPAVIQPITKDRG